jgi:hypothetical protein
MNKITILSVIFFSCFKALAQEIILNIPINKTDSISDISISESQTAFYWGDFKKSYSKGFDGTDSSAIQLGLRRYLDVFTNNFPSDTELKDFIISIDLKFDKDDVLKYDFPTSGSSTIIGATKNWDSIEKEVFWTFNINYLDTSIIDNFGLTNVKIPNIDSWNSFKFIVKNSDSTISLILNNELVSSKKLFTNLSLTSSSTLRIGAYNNRYLFAHIDNIKIELFDQLNDLVTFTTTPKNNFEPREIVRILYFDLSGKQHLEHELTTGKLYIKRILFSNGSLEINKIIK